MADETIEGPDKLVKALKAERTLRKEAEQQLRDLKANATLGTAPTAEALTTHVDALVQAELAKRGNDAASQVTVLNKELADTKATLTSLRISTAVKEAAREQHMRPEGVEHAVTLANLELSPDDSGELRTKGGDDVSAFIESLKTKAPFLWPVSRGAGGRGSGDAAPIDVGSNPWAKRSFNLTLQGQIAREAPARAQMLQAQAAAMPH